RDRTVTGVQTCALPIYRRSLLSLARLGAASGYYSRGHPCAGGRVSNSSCRETARRAAGSNRRFGFLCWIKSYFTSLPASPWRARSEERRVGKECSAVWG